jgi:predicted nucleotidyltransferase
MKGLEAIHQLASRADALKARGATSLFVFGSTARDEANANSDLDLFIEYDSKKKFSLIDLAGLKNFLEDELGLSVDVTTRDSLHPALRDEIERLAERVLSDGAEAWTCTG